MKTNGMTLEADTLSVSSKAYKLLEKLQLQENDGLRTTLLAVYWALLHHEESVAQEFGERCTLNSDTVVRKLQVVANIVVKVFRDTLSLHHMTPHLSLFKDMFTVEFWHVGNSIRDVLRDCDIKDSTLVDKLTGLCSLCLL
jgi:hypothetical protein